jgi:hypothetical protein
MKIQLVIDLDSKTKSAEGLDNTLTSLSVRRYPPTRLEARLAL